MSEDDGDEAQDEFDWYAADFEVWLEGERIFHEQLLDLLAWLWLVSRDLIPDEAHLFWPYLDLWRHEETRELAFRDPILFDLARRQIALDYPEGPERFGNDDDLQVFLRDLLTADRPRPGQGSNRARPAIKAVVNLMFQHHQDFNFWDLPLMREVGAHPSDWGHTENAFATELSNRLNQHRRLEDFPEVIPSPEALRPLLVKKAR